MSVLELFNVVTESGKYVIGYIEDGWAKEFECDVGSPSEAAMVTQNMLGNILDVTYVERCL